MPHESMRPHAASDGADPAALNRDSYNAIAAQWDAARSAPFRHEPPYLDRLTRDLAPPAAILDLGCGTGRPIAEHLLARGYAVTGVDQAEALLQLARERLPRGRWVCDRIERYAPDGQYDGAVMWDALFHIPRPLHEPILHRVLACLRPGARLILTAGGSEHPAFTDSMFGATFYYDSHPPQTLLEILRRAGAAVEHAEFINPPTPGRDKGRYGVVARAP